MYSSGPTPPPWGRATRSSVSPPPTGRKSSTGAHTIKVVANDTKADSTPYTVTFTKAVYEASITLAEPMDADDAITVMVLNVLGSIPADADLEVLVTNNANDTEPVWEDAHPGCEERPTTMFSPTRPPPTALPLTSRSMWAGGPATLAATSPALEVLFSNGS